MLAIAGGDGLGAGLGGVCTVVAMVLMLSGDEVVTMVTRSLLMSLSLGPWGTGMA